MSDGNLNFDGKRYRSTDLRFALTLQIDPDVPEEQDLASGDEDMCVNDPLFEPDNTFDGDVDDTVREVHTSDGVLLRNFSLMTTRTTMTSGLMDTRLFT